MLRDTISSTRVVTTRLETSVRFAGPEGGVPLCLVHGNVSSGVFWEELLATLPRGYRGFAPDLRGYGESETRPVDATRGVRDFSDDLEALLQALGYRATHRKVHLVGWSLGGNVVLQYAIDHPEAVASLVLVAPGSPFGFGGSRGLEGAPVWSDYAGSGGGTANPEFVQRLADGDRSADSPVSPRNVMNSFYFKPPFRVAPEREEAFLDGLLSTRTSPANYPGDTVASPNWPGLAPGVQGVNNALSPRYLDQGAFAEIDPKPPLLWIRGADDQIVSDTSLFDVGFLGQIGAVPGWPGVEVYPPQPMVSQTRAVLDRYRAHGGTYREQVFPDCGHSPHVEQHETFRASLAAFLQRVPAER